MEYCMKRIQRGAPKCAQAANQKQVFGILALSSPSLHFKKQKSPALSLHEEEVVLHFENIQKRIGTIVRSLKNV